MTNISTDALREALQLLITSDMQAEPKRLLIEAVMDTLAAREAAIVAHNSVQKVEAAWQPAEIELAAAFLKDKVASSWQNADELVTHLANQLRRNAHDVRVKAIELGLGMGVDYRLARIKNATPLTKPHG